MPKRKLPDAAHNEEFYKARRAETEKQNVETREAKERVFNRKALGLMVAERREGALEFAEEHGFSKEEWYKVIDRHNFSSIRRGEIRNVYYRPDEDGKMIVGMTMVDRMRPEVIESAKDGYLYQLRLGHVDLVDSISKFFKIPKNINDLDGAHEAAIEGCVVAYGRGSFHDSEDIERRFNVTDEDFRSSEIRKKVILQYIDSVLMRTPVVATMFREHFGVEDGDLATEDVRETILKRFCWEVVHMDPESLTHAQEMFEITPERFSSPKEREWVTEIIYDIVGTGNIFHIEVILEMSGLKISDLLSEKLNRARFEGHIRAKRQGWKNSVKRFESDYELTKEDLTNSEARKLSVEEYLSFCREGRFIELKKTRTNLDLTNEILIPLIDKHIAERITFRDAPPESVEIVKEAMKYVRNTRDSLGYPKEYLYSFRDSVIESITLAALRNKIVLDKETIRLMHDEFKVTKSEVSEPLGDLVGEWEALAK